MVRTGLGENKMAEKVMSGQWRRSSKPIDQGKLLEVVVDRVL